MFFRVQTMLHPNGMRFMEVFAILRERLFIIYLESGMKLSFVDMLQVPNVYGDQVHHAHFTVFIFYNLLIIYSVQQSIILYKVC